ncbi:MAG: MATE family efflux transporter [Clostridia bacterium]|nr:MATE family efflux transporter [Clostridia bacterium]
MDNTEKQYNRMLTLPIPKLILEMAIPAVISMMVTVIYNTADTYFVSNINKSASAAVGVVYSIMAIIQAVGYGLSMGAGSLASRMLGKKENDKANMYASSAFAVSFFAGSVVAVCGLCFLEPLLKILGSSATMMPYAVDYATYILLAAPLNCSTFVLNNVLRSGGQVAFAMAGMAIGGILNIILDPIFIFILDMGTKGAAVATAISQALSFIILAYMYISKKSVVKIEFKFISKNIKDYGEIISTGLPTIFRQSMGALSTTLLNVSAVVYGDATVSAITIANKVYVLVRNLVLGFGQGFQPVAGYNFGAGDKKRTFKAFKFTNYVGTGICIVLSVLIFVFAKPIMAWFSNDSEVVSIGIDVLYYCCAVMPFLAFSTYVNVMYQCLGFKVKATFLASCRQGIFFVPIILYLPTVIGRTGVQMAQPLADLCTFLISVPFLISFYRKEIKNAVHS